MQHRIDRAVELPPLQPLQEFALVQIVVDLAVDEVVEFCRVLEVVHRDDPVPAFAVEARNDARSDEARGACDDGVHGGLSGRPL
jgi:hypothetical protein